METFEIKDALKASEAISLGPRNYNPYIWVSIAKRLIQLTTDCPDYHGANIVEDVLLLLGKAYGIANYKIQLHQVRNGKQLEPMGDLDICFEVPIEKSKNIPEIVHLIQKRIYPGVGEWQAVRVAPSMLPGPIRT